MVSVGPLGLPPRPPPLLTSKENSAAVGAGGGMSPGGGESPSIVDRRLHVRNHAAAAPSKCSSLEEERKYHAETAASAVSEDMPCLVVLRQRRLSLQVTMASALSLADLVNERERLVYFLLCVNFSIQNYLNCSSRSRPCHLCHSADGGIVMLVKS